MPSVSKHRNGTAHRSNGTVQPSEIGRVAREIRKLDDACHVLYVGDDAIEQAAAGQEETYEAGRTRFLIGQACDVVDGKADALRRLLVFETPTSFEDVTTLLNILDAELRHFHLAYLDDRWQFDEDELATLQDRRRSVSDQERYIYSQHEKRVQILIRSIFLALHDLAPSPRPGRVTFRSSAPASLSMTSSRRRRRPRREAPMSEINRRAALASAGGMLAVGVAGAAATALPVGQSFSSEFTEYLRCVQAHIDACEGEPTFGAPEYQAWDDTSTAACHVRGRACDAIRDRPVRCWQHFVELALVVRHELWDQFGDGSWDKHSLNDELEEALQTATWWLIEGGPHV